MVGVFLRSQRVYAQKKGASDGQNTFSGKLDGQGQGNHPADISSEAPRARST